MSFLETIDESAAREKVAEQYEEEKSSRGYLPNYVQTFSLRPEVFDAWDVFDHHHQGQHGPATV